MLTRLRERKEWKFFDALPGPTLGWPPPGGPPMHINMDFMDFIAGSLVELVGGLASPGDARPGNARADRWPRSTG